MPTPETDLMRRIQIVLSGMGARVFRNNTGLGWIGRVQRFTTRTTVIVNPEDVVIRGARPLHAGLIEGSSDLIGWTDTGKFLAVEVKTETGRATGEQMNFINAVAAAGGVAFVARSTEDVIKQYEDANGTKTN